jgi:hypothetical protein
MRTTPKQPGGEAAKARPLMDEADIGSGEKTPGQLETENMIKEIPPLPRAGGDTGNAGRATGGSGGGEQAENGHDKPAPDDLPPPGATKSGKAAAGGSQA